MKSWLRLPVIMLCLIVVFTLSSAGWTASSAQPAAPDLTLQELIDAAPDGAILDIDTGTYLENLTVHDKNITLRGADPINTIIKAADSDQRVITADSNKGLSLENLTITGGHPEAVSGGGVYAKGGSLQISNCLITDNSASNGGGVFLDDPASDLSITGSSINLNTATFNGGGIFASGDATLVDTGVYTNTAGVDGGGLTVQNGNTVLTRGFFSGNQATGGNGGAVNVNNDLSITGTQFYKNTSTDQGGAVAQLNTPATVTITGGYFIDNKAYNMGGGAYISGKLSVDNTQFTGNTVDSLSSGDDVYGGGLYSLGKLTVDSSLFAGNQTNCVDCINNQGGGLDSVYETGPITIINSTFDGNNGWFGGGVSGVEINVSYSTFKNSISGGYGGGINAVKVTGDQLLFQDNTVVNNGGAIDGSEITLTHSRFIRNSAANGGAVYATDGLAGSNLLFARNSAILNGAAAYLESYAISSLYNVTIAAPTQNPGPAMFIETNAVLGLFNSIVNNYTDAIYLQGPGSAFNEDYNLFYNNGTDFVQNPGASITHGGHSSFTNPPDFIDPDTDNYHLLPTSGAIGLGHNYGLVDDLDGHPRIYGRNDAGAYQYGYMEFIPLVLK